MASHLMRQFSNFKTVLDGQGVCGARLILLEKFWCHSLLGIDQFGKILYLNEGVNNYEYNHQSGW